MNVTIPLWGLIVLIVLAPFGALFLALVSSFIIGFIVNQIDEKRMEKKFGRKD